MASRHNGQPAETVELLPDPALTPGSIAAQPEVKVERKKKYNGPCAKYGRCVCGAVHLAGNACRACRRYDYKGRARRFFSLQTLRTHLPPTQWLPKYKLMDFKGDLISGLTVALTVLPQSLAYAKIAELPPQYGLYSSFMACFMYLLLGTARDVNLGPTAVMSLLTAEFAHSDHTIATMLAFLCGVIQLVMGFLSIGFLVDYISHPVINSFTTAAAITIACSQVKKWLGLKGIPRDFIMQAVETLRKLPETKIWDFVLGLGCMIMLYILKRMREIKWNKNSTSVGMKILEQVVWITSTARNAIVVIMFAGLAAILMNHDIVPFSLTGNITSGIPPFRFPDFTVTDEDNGTTKGTMECISSMGIGIVIAPLVGVIEIIAVGKAFGRKNGYNVVANQELLAIGAANLMGSFVSAYPITASFSRSAVAAQSGVRTTLGNLFTGSIVLVALAVLTPLFYFIPDAALAAVIIMAVTDMIDFTMIGHIWHISKVDLLPWFATFVVSLLAGFEYGILLGIAVSLGILLHPWARPKIKMTDSCDINEEEVTPLKTSSTGEKDICIVAIPIGLMFPGVEFLQEKIMLEAFRDGRMRSVILDFRYVYNVDYTAVMGMKQLLEDFKRKKCGLVILNAKPSVLKKLKHGKLKDLRSADNIPAAIALLQAPSDEPANNVRRNSVENNNDKGLVDDNELTQVSLHDLTNSDGKSGSNPMRDESDEQLEDRLHEQ